MPAGYILLVEDEDNIALALEHLISRQGYRLRRVSSGEAALASLADEVPDLVLLDVLLPECSGYEVCQTMRADPAMARVKILMMSAGGDKAARRKGLALGADAFMTKPFAIADLTGQIADLLKGEG